MNTYSALLRFYRSTLKKVPLFHRLVYLSGERVVSWMEHLRHFYTDPGDPLCHRVELLFGLYEPGSTKVVKRIVQPGNVCLDIGANVGWYTTLMARLVGPYGKVVAFEPHPRTFSLLERNASHHTNVILVNKAASDRRCQIKVYDNPSGSGRTSIFPDSASASSGLNGLKAELYPRAREWRQESFEVEAIPIDEVLQSFGISSVNFVKIDIEGAEILALRGMKDTLQHSQQVSLLIEYNPDAQTVAGFHPTDLIRELQNLGFDHIGMVSDEGALIPLVEVMGPDGVPRIKGSVNLLCQKGKGVTRG